jgi:hypothetical protein
MLTMNELGSEPAELRVACFWPGFEEPYLVTTVAYRLGARRAREIPTKLLIVSVLCEVVNSEARDCKLRVVLQLG